MATCFTICTSAVGRPSYCNIGSVQVVGGLILFPAGNRSQVLYPISSDALMRSQRPASYVAPTSKHSGQWRLISQSPGIPRWAPPQKGDTGGHGGHRNTSISAPGPHHTMEGTHHLLGIEILPSTPGQPHVPRSKFREMGSPADKRAIRIPTRPRLGQRTSGWKPDSGDHDGL